MASARHRSPIDSIGKRRHHIQVTDNALESEGLSTSNQTSINTTRQLIMKPICPDRAPRTIGPYVHAVVHDNLVFTTACIPLDPATMQIVGGTPEDQFRRIFENLKIILEESGTGFDRIIKQNVYLTNFDHFEAFNTVSAEYLGEHKPARATMRVVELPKQAPMGLDVVAALA
ncbi:endoribonuclease l-PSP domain-containing [Fusarium albosuccineum]|uniref:Endoribonuclease l-PSP domain-containing n=1 Tax=Fusarium albosuccineum TaxID=1237068 RepID=A0A8H4P443_9HYPO|nr:endoribonuclease l-PSP domain-containing [Fusarium albosuccineum]